MTDSLPMFMAKYRPVIESALAEYLPLSSQPGTAALNEALQYAVFPGGKRWRPLFNLLGTLLVDGQVPQALPTACAIEYLHTSSLILDDLPAMDDTEVRRGRPALHLAFGEGIALLAALALLNQSYALLIRAAGDGVQIASRLIGEATRCLGSDGMIGGQAADLEMPAHVSRAEAMASCNLKTTALTRLMMTSGAIAAAADEGDIAALSHFGVCFGAAFQVYDDLVDEIGKREPRGKPGQQNGHHPSFVAELGIDGSHRLAASLVEEGRTALTERFGQRHEVRLLTEASDFLLKLTGVPVNEFAYLEESPIR